MAERRQYTLKIGQSRRPSDAGLGWLVPVWTGQRDKSYGKGFT